MTLKKNLIANYRSTKHPPTIELEGVWKNGLGSEMVLGVDAAGNVKGIYKTNVGMPASTEEFPLVGFASGDLISFTVNFGKYGSLTAWTGQHTENEEGDPEIHTLWHLAENILDEQEPYHIWAGILAGSNRFTR